MSLTLLGGFAAAVDVEPVPESAWRLKKAREPVKLFPLAPCWRTADLAFARGSLDDAETALGETRAVLAVTQREQWIAYTLAGLASPHLVKRKEGPT